MKAITKKSDKLKLPIKPTKKPNGTDISEVALHVLDIAQFSLLSPAAVVSSLRCALAIYEEHMHAKGFSEEAIKQCEVLGVDLAHMILKPKEQPAPGLVDSLGAPLTQETAQTLVDSTGAPLTAE